MMALRPECPRLFRPSNAMPPVIEPSPMMATMRRSSPSGRAPISRAVASHSYGRAEHLLAIARGCAVLLHSTRTDARGRDDLAMVGFQRLLWLDLASGAATAAVRLQALADLAPDRLAWRDGALELVKLFGQNGPRRIVYVACSPSTLARDAGALVGVHGYRLRAAGISNMFPHTAHVESMALFERD